MAAAIAALYVHDCVVLLHWNEALLASPWPGKWLPVFGSRTFTLRGMEVALAGVLLPAAPTFRLDWPTESAGPESDGWEDYLASLRLVQWCSLAAFISTIVVFPAALLLRVGDGALLFLLAIVYASIGATLIVVCRRRQQLRLTRAALATLAFEVLACPPLGANVARKLSLAVPVREDFVRAARRLLSGADMAQCVAEIKARLREEITAEEEGSVRYNRLREREARLQ